MHNSCSKVLSADKSQRLHLLFIENSSHLNPLTNRVSSKHSTYFFSSRCLCFGKDLSGLISRDEGVRRGMAGGRDREMVRKRTEKENEAKG